MLAARRLGPDEPATLAGRSCENDEMGDYVLPRDLAAGDLIALRTTGAYTYSMASNYNRFGRPPVVFVRDGHHRRVVRGESADDVMRLDLFASPSRVAAIFGRSVVIARGRTYTQSITHETPLNAVALASASPDDARYSHRWVCASPWSPARTKSGPCSACRRSSRRLRHARGKAAGAARSSELIVAADTVVDLDGEALGKPTDTAQARAMLRRLAGRWHVVHSAFALETIGRRPTAGRGRVDARSFRRS